MVVFAVTNMLVIGYSWQNTHRPMPGVTDYGFTAGWKRFITVIIGQLIALVFSLLPRPVTGRARLRQLFAASVSRLGEMHSRINTEHLVGGETEQWHIAQLKDELQISAHKLATAKGQLQFVNFEPPLQGLWPIRTYKELFTTLLELIELYRTMINVVERMQSPWTHALIESLGWNDYQFTAEQSAVFYMCSMALKSGTPLPQVTPAPLISRYFTFQRKFARKHSELSLAGHKDNLLNFQDIETLKDEQYVLLGVGCATFFSILNRLDRLMFLTKTLVGEMFENSLISHRQVERYISAQTGSRTNYFKQPI